MLLGMHTCMWYTIRLLHTPCDQLQLLLLLLTLFVANFGIFFPGTAALGSQPPQTLACPCKTYIYHSQWSENNLCSYCNDFLLSGKIGFLSQGLLREYECIPCTVPCPNCVSCFPGPFAVMLFMALWNNQDDTYTNSAHVVGA